MTHKAVVTDAQREFINSGQEILTRLAEFYKLQPSDLMPCIGHLSGILLNRVIIGAEVMTEYKNLPTLPVDFAEKLKQNFIHNVTMGYESDQQNNSISREFYKTLITLAEKARAAHESTQGTTSDATH